MFVTWYYLRPINLELRECIVFRFYEALPIIYSMQRPADLAIGTPALGPEERRLFIEHLDKLRVPATGSGATAHIPYYGWFV